MRHWAPVLGTTFTLLLCGVIYLATLVSGPGPCERECHPKAHARIKGVCHCAVEGGWMLPPREQETEEVKD